MDDKTLTALKQSIEHWEANASAMKPEDASTDRRDCALCVEFWDNPFCAGCPVAKAGYALCDLSPYEQAMYALVFWRAEPHSTPHRGAFRQAANAELAFLKSLLPTETNGEPK